MIKVVPWYKNFEIWVGIRTLLLFLCFCRWLASSGNQKFGVSPVRFKRSKDLLERSIIPPSLDLPKFQFFVSLLDPEPVFFGRFPLFGRFQAERARTSPPNPDVSVSNAPFSPRNSSSSEFLGRKLKFDPTFRRIPRCSFSCSKNPTWYKTFTILKVLTSSEVL